PVLPRHPAAPWHHVRPAAVPAPGSLRAFSPPATVLRNFHRAAAAGSRPGAAHLPRSHHVSAMKVYFLPQPGKLEPLATGTGRGVELEWLGMFSALTAKQGKCEYPRRW